jgi:hypothetical protein
MKVKAFLPMNQTDDLKVFISSRDSTCDECHEKLGRHAWILLTGERGALCLACADLHHLAFLPSGNAALTRRAKKHSRLHAVVLKWSAARKRYERQGLLVEEEALANAETECLADAEVRRRRCERNAQRRAELDEQFVLRFAQRIREIFPGCPDRERTIAEFACRKYSGRIGRSVAAKHLDEDAVRLAVIAHVRHVETDYDTLLGRGVDRYDARRRVQAQIERVLANWETRDPDATE